MTTAEICDMFKSSLDNGDIIFITNGELYFNLSAYEYKRFVINALRDDGYELYSISVNSTTTKNCKLYGSVLVKPIEQTNMLRYLQEEMLSISSITDALGISKLESAGLYDHTYKLFMRGALTDKIKELRSAGLTDEEIAKELDIKVIRVKSIV